MLLVRRLFLQFDAESRPIADISETFAIPEGVSLLVGASGSGKTSLLRLMSGWYESDLENPRSFLLDANFDPLRDVEFIGNHQTLLPWYTVRKNIALRESQAASDDALKYWIEAGLPADAIDKFPYELSLGMYKRAELVAALGGVSRVLFLDEFFSSLDPDARERCLGLIERKCTNGKAVLITTHTPEAFPRKALCRCFR